MSAHSKTFCKYLHGVSRRGDSPSLRFFFENRSFLFLQGQNDPQIRLTFARPAVNFRRARPGQHLANPGEDDAPEVEIVVTPTRTERDLSTSASPVTVITREQIAAKKSFDILDVLRQTPGLSIAQTGTFGKSASVFLRGASSSQTLVLLDGVRANSPSDGRFDFGTVPIENVERIEVLRGPQGALYGADAIGGVINIITRRGEGPLQTGGAIEYGSQNTNKQIVNVRGSLGKDNRTGISFSASRLDTNGFFDNDDFRSLNASLRLDRALNANSQLSFIGRIEDGKGGTPGQRFLSFDPNARSEPRLLNGTLQFTNTAMNGTRVTRRDRASLGLTHRTLNFNDPLNPGAQFPSFTDSNLRDQVLVGDAQTTFERGPHALSLGGELRRESARGDSDSTFGPSNFDQATTTRAVWRKMNTRAANCRSCPACATKTTRNMAAISMAVWPLLTLCALAGALKPASRPVSRAVD